MPPESIIFGVGTALMGVTGLWHREWLLAETPKGRFLVEAFGPGGARWALASFLVLLSGFGVSLAMGWLAPVRW